MSVLKLKISLERNHKEFELFTNLCKGCLALILFYLFRLEKYALRALCEKKVRKGDESRG